MVVEKLQLGAYKSLNIDPAGLGVSDQAVHEQMNRRVTDHMEKMGLDDSETSAVAMMDDQMALNLDIEGVIDIATFEVHVKRRLFQELLVNTVMRQVLDNVTIDYNEEAVEAELDIMMKDIEKQAVETGFTLEFFCDYNKLDDVASLEELNRQEIRTSYLEVKSLEAIAEVEGIHMTEEQTREAMTAYTLSTSNPVEDKEAFKSSLIIQETVNWLVAQNI